MQIKYAFFWLNILSIIHLNGAYGQECIDKEATILTKRLYENIYNLKDSFTIFGHQDALAYGVGWKGIKGKSDIYDVVKDYPGLYGWDIANIELGRSKNIDGVPFKKMKEYILDAFSRGSLITISWHANNPLTGKNAWDTSQGTVSSILPGGSNHKKYTRWLDRIAEFLKSLQTKAGIGIPILFRPFHELTGSWFWWGKNFCTNREFIELWKFTQNYLKDQKNIHQLIYVFNTANFANKEEYLSRYPGDDKVDILSFDQYQYEGSTGKKIFLETMNHQLKILTSLGKTHNKIISIAETGFEAVPDPVWWTGTLYPLLKDFPVSSVLVWRNAGLMKNSNKMHYYAPFPGQISEMDFKLFYQSDKMLFGNQLKNITIYH